MPLNNLLLSYHNITVTIPLGTCEKAYKPVDRESEILA